MSTSVADKIEIHELITRLYQAVDGHRPDGFAACFSAEGVFDANKYGEFRGHPSISEFMKNHIAKGNEDGARHCVSNLIVEDAPNGLTVRAYVMKFRIDKLPGIAVGTALLLAHVKKGTGGWKIDRLTMEMPVQRPASAATS
jgi:hypothetical protein